MHETDAWQDHEKFRELCAVAQGKALSFREQLELNRHIASCLQCQVLCREYALLTGSGMAYLSGEEEILEAAEQWDDRRVRENLRVAIQAPLPPSVIPPERAHRGMVPFLPAWKGAMAAALAACAVTGLLFAAYRRGEQAHPPVVERASVPAVKPAPLAAAESHAPAAELAEEAATMARMEKQLARQEQEITHLRGTAEAAQQEVIHLSMANGEKDATLRSTTAERDQLVTELAEKQKAYDLLQVDYSRLRTEHDRSLLDMASLNAEVTTLQAASREQESRLKDDEQYLTSDRDIRELMGARKLYIADVFDVDSRSRTRKPFGRVFYTQSKSLVFYAFDLDHQPGVRNSSVFQVWGERDGEANAASKAMSLGILYMDSETNRRWVLRSDDPKQLAEIDAVFVTLEPDGGSRKPTGKPLLYALLRKEANHP